MWFYLKDKIYFLKINLFEIINNNVIFVLLIDLLYKIWYKFFFMCFIFNIKEIKLNNGYEFV